MNAGRTLVIWLNLLTPTELDELAGEYGWAETHLDWRARPAIITFLEAIDALIIEQRRGQRDLPAALDRVDAAFDDLGRRDIQDLFRSYRRLARNREKDASEPVQRFHAAIADLLAEALTRHDDPVDRSER